MYMGVTTYGPAAAVESVTNIPTSINIFVIVTVCTVYTAMVRHVTVFPAMGAARYAQEAQLRLLGNPWLTWMCKRS